MWAVVVGISLIGISQIVMRLKKLLIESVCNQEPFNCSSYSVQGCNKGQKSGGAGSNAARRRCPAAPSDLPKSGGAAAPTAPPLVACLHNHR